jgi:hypothetical protein
MTLLATGIPPAIWNFTMSDTSHPSPDQPCDLRSSHDHLAGTISAFSLESRTHHWEDGSASRERPAYLQEFTGKGTRNRFARDVKEEIWRQGEQVNTCLFSL